MKIKPKRTFSTENALSLFKKSVVFLACFLLVGITNVYAQTKSISGKVTDEANEPLIGVSVRIQGTTTGTITDIDGLYTISAQTGDVLEFSFVGMTAQTIRVASQTAINVVLKDDAQMLGETVVIGYGSAKSKDLTSPIATIKGDAVNRHLTASPMQGLQGKVAGLQITNSGAPGTSPQVKIRGVGSFTNDKTGPLYVVDGMFVDNIDFLSNNDIVNISVLKDASAAAIYGVRAANGVIIITTKTGGMSRPTEVTYDGFVGVQTPMRVLKMANSAQYTTWMNEAQLGASNYAGENGQNLVNQTKNGVAGITNSVNRFGGTNGVPNTNTDWFSELLRPALMNSHSITATGGGETVSYVLNTNYLNQRGMADVDNGFERLNVRAQLDANLYKWLKVGANVLLVNSTNRTMENAAFGNAYATPSIVPIYDQNNSAAFPHPFASVRDVMLDDHFRNPVATATYYNNITAERSILPTFYAQFTLLDDKLTLRSSFNQKATFRKNNIYRPRYTVGSNQQNPISTLDVENTDENSWLVDNVATYRDVFNKDHNYTVMLGQSVRQLRERKLKGTARNVPEAEHLWLINNGDKEPRQVEGSGFTSATVSVFGRLMYDYKSRYLLSATFRADGSSKYTERWGYFPSVGLGWVLTQEDFMKNQQMFDFLKLRGSWGQLGNDNVDSNSGPTITSSNAVFNDEVIPGLNTFSLVAPTKWEVVEETNIGLDFATLNSRLSGELDYFTRTTNNAVLRKIVPLTTATVLANIGSIRNSGFELTLNWTDRIGKDFNYNVGFNISTLKNEVLDLGGIDQEQANGTSIIRRVGEPLNSFYGYQVEGVYQNQAEIDAHLHKMSPDERAKNVKPGDFRYKDTNGDGEITADDRVILGSPLPKLFIGGNIGFDYKNFDFNMAVQGNFGGKIYNGNRFDRYQHPTANIDADLYENRWTGEGSSNTHVSSVGLFNKWNYGIDGSTMTSNLVESSSSFTIQNIQLGYTFRNLFPEKNNKSTLRVNFTAERPISFFSYNGFTPEITDQWGSDRGLYPLASIYSIGVKLIY